MPTTMSPGHDHAVVTTSGIGGHDGVTVNATDAGAVIKVEDKGPGTRSMFMLTSDHPGPNGYRSASYEARGPVGGPIMVATVFAKRDHADDLRHDARALLRQNVGG